MQKSWGEGREGEGQGRAGEGGREDSKSYIHHRTRMKISTSLQAGEEGRRGRGREEREERGSGWGRG